MRFIKTASIRVETLSQLIQVVSTEKTRDQENNTQPVAVAAERNEPLTLPRPQAHYAGVPGFSAGNHNL
jgi:hypothetical protein